MTFRLVTDEGDPEEIGQRERVKETLRGLIDRVDEMNLTELVFVLSGNGHQISGRQLSKIPYPVIGLLEWEKMQLLAIVDDQLVDSIDPLE